MQLYKAEHARELEFCSLGDAERHVVFCLVILLFGIEDGRGSFISLAHAKDTAKLKILCPKVCGICAFTLSMCMQTIHLKELCLLVE